MNIEELNKLHLDSCDLILPYLQLEGREKKPLDTENAKKDLENGMNGLLTVLKFNPTSWSAMWMLGKAHQSKEEHQPAYDYFKSAHRVYEKEDEYSEKDVLRELALESLYLGKTDDSVYYCQTAVELDLEDYSLWANLSIAKLYQGKLDEAEQWANRTLVKVPTDEIAKDVLKVIKEIKSGTRTLPIKFPIDD